jgi:hypothetical protein
VITGQRDGNADDNTDRDQHQNFARHQPEHIGAPRPQRHPDTEFIRPSRDDVGHYAIDPDAREKNCEQSEDGRELGDETLVRNRACHLLVESCQPRDGQVAVNRVDGLLDGSGDRIAFSAPRAVLQIARLKGLLNGKAARISPS